jgi:hypothetical protein
MGSVIFTLKRELALVVMVLVAAGGLLYFQSNHDSLLPGKPKLMQNQFMPLWENDTASDSSNATNSFPPPDSVSQGVSPITSNSQSSPVSGLTSNPELGVYRYDPSKSQSQTLQVIDWTADGLLEPGQARNSPTTYFRNEGQMSRNLLLSTSNWIFKGMQNNSLSQEYQRYFTLTWNYDNSTIAVNEIKPVIFTLSVSSNITDVTNFSFDIIVTMY